MIIDKMLTRWFNFEFGVLSHIKNSQPTTYCYAHLVVKNYFKFIPMMAPPSDQGWETAFTTKSWSRPPKTMSSAWKVLPSPHFSYTYKAQNIV